MKISQLTTNLFIAIIVTFIANSWLNIPGRAEVVSSQKRSPQEEPKKPKSSKPEKLDFSGDGRPGRRAGGGSRSSCPSTQIPLTALIPAKNIGTTVSDRPSLWFYVPYAPQQATSGEFVLQDKQENDVYRQTFNLSQTPGLVSFKLPQSAPPLAINQSYRWYFKLYCDDSLTTANFVEGWIARTPLPPDLETRLKSEQSPAYLEYGSNSIWFDSLDSLAQLRLKKDNPQLQNDWNKLLGAEGVKLDRLSDQPLLGKVTNLVGDGK